MLKNTQAKVTGEKGESRERCYESSKPEECDYSATIVNFNTVYTYPPPLP